MTQFYVLEIQQYANGEYGHIVHFAADENPDKARNKGDAKYYEVLSAAAVSELPSHSAVLVASDGTPIMNKCYTHNTEAV